jgi:hypothetical protein
MVRRRRMVSAIIVISGIVFFLVALYLMHRQGDG